MNLRRLESFLAVAEHGSFRAAAERLHRSQSAVSLHVQDLEQELGVSLFERTTRRVTLTPEGRTLQVRSKGVVADLQGVANELREHSGLRRGRVSIGTAPSIATHRLAQVIASFHQQYPGVTLEMHEAFAKTLYEDVLQRVTDFAIGPRIREMDDFLHAAVMDDPIVAVLPRDLAIGRAGTVSLRDLAKHPQLSMPRGTAIRDLVERAFRSAKLDFSPRFEVTHQQTLFNLVSAGLGVTLLPSMSLPEAPQPGYRIASVSGPEIMREICLITLKGKTLSPAAARCAEMIVGALRAHGARQGGMRRRERDVRPERSAPEPDLTTPTRAVPRSGRRRSRAED